MANIGIARASYFADSSISRLGKDTTKSVQSLADAGIKNVAGDNTSLSSMGNNFALDAVAKKAAIKSMSITQAYLSTAISTLDSASKILSQLHELAVLGANSSNSALDNEAINTEAELLADEFHKSMITANYKGRAVFNDSMSNAIMAAGGNGAQYNFDFTNLDYDDLYDYKNPPLTSLDAGIKYEIRRELSAQEKDAILSRAPDVSEAQLIPGFQFTTLPADNQNLGEGSINVLDSADNVATYVYNSNVSPQRVAVSGEEPVLQIDPNAVVDVVGDFRGGYLDFEISENFELGDKLQVLSTSDISVNEGIVSYSTTVNGQSVDVEIGIIDEQRNGINGNPLRINLRTDATVPGTSNIQNGDFSTLRSDISSYSPQYADRVVRTEARVGNVTDLSVDAEPANPTTVQTFQNIELNTVTGNGSGARVSVTISDGILHNFTFLDGGEGYAIGDELSFSIDINDDGVPVTYTTTVQATQDAEVQVTNPRFRDVGTGVFEDREVSVPGPIIGYEDPVTDPETGVVTPGDAIRGPSTTETRSVEITTSVYDGEDPEYLPREIIGYSENRTNRVADWTIYENRVYFGQDFEILDSLDGSLIQTDPANGTVASPESSYRRTVIPTPELEDMAAPIYEPYVSPFDPTVSATPTDEVKNRDDLGATANDFDVSRSADGRLELDTGEVGFNVGNGYGILHGPAAVSDTFAAEEGQYLKLDYAAEKLSTGDDYHVAGYIYEVDENGDAIRDNGVARITMAFSDTGTDGAGEASVKVETTANYRFVFIGGTFDKTGLTASGARMFIDNIVSEDPYTTTQDAIQSLARAVHYSNTSDTATASKKLSTTLSNAAADNVLKDDSLLNLVGFNPTDQTDGAYMLAPTLDLVIPAAYDIQGSTQEMTSRIEAVQERINTTRAELGSHYFALQSAIDSTTDLRSQFMLATGTLSDVNFSRETAHLTKMQVQYDVATSVLAQANQAQTDLLSLISNQFAEPM